MAFNDAVVLRSALRRRPPFIDSSLRSGDLRCEATKSDPISGGGVLAFDEVYVLGIKLVLIGDSGTDIVFIGLVLIGDSGTDVVLIGLVAIELYSKGIDDIDE